MPSVIKENVNLEKGGEFILYILSIATVVFTVFDYIQLPERNPLQLTLPVSLVSVISLIFYQRNIIRLKIGFLIIIVALQTKFIASLYFVPLNNPDSILIREALFSLSIAGFSAIYAYRWLSFVVVLSYTAHLWYYSDIHRLFFIQDNLAPIAIIMLLFVSGMSFFSLLIHKVLNMLKERQESLNKTNEVLLTQHDELLRQKDITERKNFFFQHTIEELNETKNELEQLNETKAKLFKAIAHDIRGPISTIFGLSEIIYSKGSEMNEVKLRKFNEGIFKTTKSLSFLVENLLIWSKGQLRKPTPNREQINMCAVVKGTVDLLKSYMEDKQINIQGCTMEEFHLNADKNMMLIVVRNLLSNAIKYTHKGGFVYISLVAEKDNLLFEITDTGIGIPPEVGSQLFTNPTVESRRGTEGEKGAGIGLAICKEYIDLHNGEIGFESKDKQGARFWFSIPSDKDNHQQAITQSEIALS